jgi:hypothetical protein
MFAGCPWSPQPAFVVAVMRTARSAPVAQSRVLI